jgi:hypothetical protein
LNVHAGSWLTRRNVELKETVADLSFRRIKEAVTAMESRGKVIEVADEGERLHAMAQDYAKNPSSTLVISPANRERAQLNSLIHRELQRDGTVSRDDHQTKSYDARNDMTGAERSFAHTYRPEDVIRYNRNSKVYKVKAGDYAKVIDTNHEKNESTVRSDNGRSLTYNPTRLSGVNVYTEAERLFAEGDRIQFRTTACRIAGIRDLYWHDLRHTFGTRLAEAGCSEATIASLMGHSDPQTTRRYTHATDRAKRAAVEAVRVLRENVCHKSATTQKRRPLPIAVNA